MTARNIRLQFLVSYTMVNTVNTIVHDQHKNCFSLDIDGAEAVLEYQLVDPQHIDFTRTFVPPALRGKGVAESLVRHGLDWAKIQHLEISASCWYVEKFLR